MLTRKQEISKLVEYQKELDHSITHIYLLTKGGEERPAEPINLLVVSNEVISVGIQPLSFSAMTTKGLSIPYVVTEISLEELEEIKSRKIKLPDGLILAKLLYEKAPTKVF